MLASYIRIKQPISGIKANLAINLLWGNVYFSPQQPEAQHFGENRRIKEVKGAVQIHRIS